MAIQTAVADRDAYVNNIGTALVNGTIEIRTGAPEANCAAGDTGTLLVSIPLGATPFTTASGSGQLVMAASHNANASNGTVANAGHFRAKTSGGTPRLQGTCGQSSTAVTSSATAANGDVLAFASAPPLAVVGARLSGTNIPAGTVVAAIVGATLVMSKSSTAGVGSGVTVTIDFDLNIDNPSIVSPQTITIASLSYTPGDQ